MDRNHYRFRSTWVFEAPPAAVYGALEAVDRYPRWWPEIRGIRQIDDITGEIRCRSLLPYELTFVVSQAVRDPGARVLEASMTGDLEGHSRWTITPSTTGSVAVFDEEVVVNKALLRRLAPIARPAFRANHSVMMRHGQRGLGAYLRTASGHTAVGTNGSATTA